MNDLDNQSLLLSGLVRCSRPFFFFLVFLRIIIKGPIVDGITESVAEITTKYAVSHLSRPGSRLGLLLRQREVLVIPSPLFLEIWVSCCWLRPVGFSW